MSERLRAQITVCNETDQLLIRTWVELAHGQWVPADGNAWHPPTTIAPGEEREFRSEGRGRMVKTKGTEGRIRFQVGDDPSKELYIHWNVPLIPSPYGNTYHVWAPPGFEAGHWGGDQRNRAKLLVRLRPSEVRSVPGFSPSANGFQFANAWETHLPVMTVGRLWSELVKATPAALIAALAVPVVGPAALQAARNKKLTDAGDGLCGGMVFATMDYWNADQRPPALEASPTSPDDALFLYIRERLIDSFDFSGRGHRWLAYSSPHYPDGDEGVFQEILGLTKGRSWVSFREEWPRIRDDIEQGNPRRSGSCGPESSTSGRTTRCSHMPICRMGNG